jgi:hypothetical protein
VALYSALTALRVEPVRGGHLPLQGQREAGHLDHRGADVVRAQRVQRGLRLASFASAALPSPRGRPTAAAPTGPRPGPRRTAPTPRSRPSRRPPSTGPRTRSDRRTGSRAGTPAAACPGRWTGRRPATRGPPGRRPGRTALPPVLLAGVAGDVVDDQAAHLAALVDQGRAVAGHLPQVRPGRPVTLMCSSQRDDVVLVSSTVAVAASYRSTVPGMPANSTSVLHEVLGGDRPRRPAARGTPARRRRGWRCRARPAPTTTRWWAWCRRAGSRPGGGSRRARTCRPRPAGSGAASGPSAAAGRRWSAAVRGGHWSGSQGSGRRPASRQRRPTGAVACAWPPPRRAGPPPRPGSRRRRRRRRRPAPVGDAGAAGAASSRCAATWASVGRSGGLVLHQLGDLEAHRDLGALDVHAVGHRAPGEHLLRPGLPGVLGR